MDETNSAAQEAAAGAETQHSEAQMIPKERFNQVIAEREAARKMAAEAQEMAQAAIAQVTQLSEAVARQQAPVAPPEEVPDIDPVEAKRIEYLLKKTHGPLIDSLTKTLQQTQAQLAALQNAQAVARMPNVAPEIRAAAEANVKKFGCSMEVGLKLAIGDAWIAQEQKKAGDAANRARMNGSLVLPFQGGAPPATAISPSAASDLPPNFASLAPKEQLKVLRARGVEDKPL